MMKPPDAIDGFSRCTTSFAVPHRLFERSATNDDVDERDDRGISHAAPKRDLAFEERGVILPARELDAVVLGVKRLHDRLAQRAHHGPARPATCVSSWNVRSPARKSATPSPTSAEIDTDERDAREVVPLGDHLRPDEHVEFAGSEAGEQRGERALAPNRVAIDPADARRRKPVAQMLFDLLGAEASVLEIWRRALPAGLRHHHRVVAVMTARPPSLTGGMHGQRDGAIRALEGVAALPAEDSGRVAAAIEKHEHLLASLQPLVNRCRKRARDDDVGTLVCVLLAHVDQAHGCERSIEHTPLQSRFRVLP